MCGSVCFRCGILTHIYTHGLLVEMQCGTLRDEDFFLVWGRWGERGRGREEEKHS